MKSPIRPVLSQLRPNGIVAVAHLGLDRPGLIPLWFGETDLVTPAFIRDAASKALADGKTFYTWARGIPELREAIAGFHARTLGLPIDPERVTVPGAAMPWPYGGKFREVQIDLDPVAMQARGLSGQDVANALAQGRQLNRKHG